MKGHITPQEWLTLDADTRRQFKDKFLIRGTSPTEILHDVNAQTRIISDGVNSKDLAAAFSIEHMIGYLGEDLPWYRDDLVEYLFKLVQDKFYGRTVEWSNGREDRNVVTDGNGSTGSAGEAQGVNPKRKGRPRKEPQAV